MLMKPERLKKGDRVATISLSWGGAGEPELSWRYEQGIERLRDVFGLEVVALPNSLKGDAYLYENPQARAEDLMTAFADKSIKAIISNIGGSDSIRLLPYIDFEIIRNNPKIFMGYSDTTMSHLFCYQAGLSSFYGPCIMVDFAENVSMDPYTVDKVNRTLFASEPIGEIAPAEKWTSEHLEWAIENKHKRRTMQVNQGYEVLQGSGVVKGHLMGGCIEALEFAKGTSLWPDLADWKNSILFFETSEEQSDPEFLTRWLRNYAAQGILQQVNGIIFAKPYGEVFYDEYKAAIQQVMKEFHLGSLPIMYNLNFGHTEPKMILPYGTLAEVDCDKRTFAILESGVK